MPKVEKEIKDYSLKTGELIGYTAGGAQKTFYFKRGRLTQQHKDPENVGWHNAHNVVRSNVSSYWAEKIHAYRRLDKNSAGYQEYNTF